MTKSQKIYDDYFDLVSNDNVEIIRFYEKNALFLDNKTGFNDINEFNDYLIILSDYVVSLENIGKYQKCIKYADKAINLIESKVKEYSINLNDFGTYWNVLTCKGRTLSRIKDYKGSILVFNKLLDWDTENDYYKEWLENSKSKKRNSINKYLFVIAWIFFLLSIISEHKLSMQLLTVGIVLFLFNSINEYFGDKIINWVKKSN